MKIHTSMSRPLRRFTPGQATRTVMIEDGFFSGSLTYKKLMRVTRPVDVTCAGEKLRIVGEDFTWLEFVPRGKTYAMLAAFTDTDALAQWYFDATAENFPDAPTPYFVDMYLDFAMLPDGRGELLDEDELADAVRAGMLTEAQARGAYDSIRALRETVASDPARLERICRDYLQLMRRLSTDVADTGEGDGTE